MSAFAFEHATWTNSSVVLRDVDGTTKEIPVPESSGQRRFHPSTGIFSRGGRIFSLEPYSLIPSTRFQLDVESLVSYEFAPTRVYLLTKEHDRIFIYEAKLEDKDGQTIIRKGKFRLAGGVGKIIVEGFVVNAHRDEMFTFPYNNGTLISTPKATTIWALYTSVSFLSARIAVRRYIRKTYFGVPNFGTQFVDLESGDVLRHHQWGAFKSKGASGIARSVHWTGPPATMVYSFYRQRNTALDGQAVALQDLEFAKQQQEMKTEWFAVLANLAFVNARGNCYRIQNPFERSIVAKREKRKKEIVDQRLLLEELTTRTVGLSAQVFSVVWQTQEQYGFC